MIQLPLFSTVESNWVAPKLYELPSWKDAKRVGVDIETRDPDLRTLGPSGGRRPNSYITGVSFAIEDGPGAYLPMRHQGGGNLPVDAVLCYLREQALLFTGELCGANLPYDLDFLAGESVHFNNVSFFRDIQVADPLISELHMSYSMQSIAGRYDMDGKDESILRAAAVDYGIDPKKDMWVLPAKFVGAYGEEDARLPLRILRRQEREIDDQDLWKVYNLESRLLPVLTRLRRRGVRIDLDRLGSIEEWSLQEESAALNELHRLTGIRIALGDVWRAEAIAPVLRHLGATVKLTPKSGKPQVDKAAFATISHPAARAVERARKVNKLRTTFAQSIRNHLVGDRIHCTFNQLKRAKDGEESTGDETSGAAYGRLSCEHPNLQQQPSRDEFAKMWRSIYLPESGKLWASCDYCFSSDTEILTERGFVGFPELLPSDLVAQYDVATKNISYAKPIERQKVWYSGNLVNIVGERTLNLLVTPNHNCLLRQTNGAAYFCKAEDYKQQGAKKQVVAGIAQGHVTISKSDIVTSVAVQADGSYRDSGYRIWVSKVRKVERIIAHCTFTNTYVGEKKGNQTAFVISTEAAPLVLPGRDKLFNRQLLLSLTLDCRKQFLEELLLWDGTGVMGNGGRYCSTVKQNVEIVQEVAILSGYRARMGKDWEQPGVKKTLYRVGFSPMDEVWTDKFQHKTEAYNGYVYCVTMPNSTVVVRRKGAVAITGQSQQEPRMAVHYASLSRDLIGQPAWEKACEARDKYRDDPSTDNHQMMADMAGIARKPAKDIFLGLCYGMGGAKLCRTLGLSTMKAVSGERRGIHSVDSDEGKRLIANGAKIFETAGLEGQALLKAFDEKVSFIKLLAKACEKVAKSRGYITTLGARRCRFPKDTNGNYEWTHKALNRLIQGSSADQTKQAMIDVTDAGFDIIVQVHDEIAFSVNNETEAHRAAKIMMNCTPLQLPSKVDTEVGESWGHSMGFK